MEAKWHTERQEPSPKAEPAVQENDERKGEEKLLPFWVLGIIILIVIAATAFIFLAYSFAWPWAGFRQNNSTKTLWDWLQLLIVPLVLAAGGFWFSQIQKQREEGVTKQRSEHEHSLAQDNQHEVALQGYLDKMSAFILKDHFSSSAEGAEIREIVRALTLTVLTHLDARRKGRILQFLYESKLLTTNKPPIDSETDKLPLIDLSGADLSKADLSGTELSRADLRGANLSGAHLCKANLIGTDLRKVNLRNARLHMANLREADLREADLRNARLHMANLREANLHRADLREANLTGADLYETDLVVTDLGQADLRGAYMRESASRENNQHGDDQENYFKLHGTILIGAKYNSMTHWPDGFRPDTRAIANNDCVLPVFVDFGVSPARLANAILTQGASFFDGDHVPLGNDEQVVIEFDLEKGDLAQIEVVVFGLVSRMGTHEGNARMNLCLNEKPFIADYTIPGAGFLPRSATFRAPHKMLVAGRNSLKLQIDSAAQTYFWLYSLEIRPLSELSK